MSSSVQRVGMKIQFDELKRRTCAGRGICCSWWKEGTCQVARSDLVWLGRNGKEKVWRYVSLVHTPSFLIVVLFVASYATIPTYYR